MVNSGSEPAYKRVARMLENWIVAGEDGYGPGWVLPTADRLARELGYGPRTIRDAYAILAEMGLVTIRRGYGTQVRTPREREIIEVPPGTSITARMPTFAEVDDWQLEPGVPMLVADGRAWPADRFELRVSDDSEPPPTPEGGNGK